MEHHFDIEIAIKYGIKEAIILNNIMHWSLKDMANGDNYHDGRYWVFNSIKAWNELYPYMTNKSIRNALQHLMDEGVLISGCYNPNPYERTLWYSITDKAWEEFGFDIKNMDFQKGKCIFPKGQMELPKMENGDSQKGKCITNINHTNTNPNGELFSSIEEKSITNNSARKIFVKPKPEEVDEYSNYLGHHIDGNQFCDFYESKGWMVGKNHMKDWKAAVRTWINQEKNYGKPNCNQTFGRTGRGNQSNGFNTSGFDAKNSGEFYRHLQESEFSTF